MRKIILLLSITLLSLSQANAKEYTKAEEEEMIQKFLKYQKEIDESNKKVAESKAELDSAKKVNEKLDEILGVLEKDKK
jgi:hypothetical protein